MALSRLENFLKNSLGNTLYVDPTEIDSTDSITNQGNSQTKPFKTIQRALIEATRFSYVEGKYNDRYNRVTIVVAPGTHYIDNRPGYIAYDDVFSSSTLYYSRFGQFGLVLSPFDLNTNFDVTTTDNELYKLNSVNGGIIIPRGVSLVGRDLKKTKIIPKYVPDPENSEIEASSIFRLTGGSYVSNFTILDGDITGSVYKNYTTIAYTPKFSHHKLTAFEYADGVGVIRINDSFLNIVSTLTDLDNYYRKISDVFDTASARPIEPDYPSGSLDIEKRVEEYRIISTATESIGVTSIRSGNGVIPTTTITVELESDLVDLQIDSPITIAGVSTSVYNGTFIVSGITSATKFTYSVPTVPNVAIPGINNATASIEVDTIESNAPELNNINKRSVYGMNSAHFDGQKVSGFKKAIVSRFYGTALQKDDAAFLRFNDDSDTYQGSDQVDNLHTDPVAVYKPSYSSYHIKASNGAVVDVDSSQATGHTNQFVAESGSEIDLNGSKSNYGENAFLSKGFKNSAYALDDTGYITHVISPQETDFKNINVDYLPLDVQNTISIGNSTRLYLFDEKNADKSPQHITEAFRIGAKFDEKLNVSLNIYGNQTNVYSKVVIPSTLGVTTSVAQKVSIVNRNSIGVNSITANSFVFSKNHEFINGESVRIVSDTGEIPTELDNDEKYYAITSGLGNDTIRLARTLNDALSGNFIQIGNSGGELKVISYVYDKIPGEIGHPIQFDESNKQWYVNVSNLTEDNQIYSTFVSYGTTALGAVSPKTYVKRNYNTRNIEDSIFKFRYVIPSDVENANTPTDGSILQESNTTTAATNSELSTVNITSTIAQKNFRFITDAVWNSNTATIITEKPHDLTVGSVIEVENLASSGNATGIGSSGFNGKFEVIGINSERSFNYTLSDNPGSKVTNSDIRLVDNLAYFKRKEYSKNFYVYNVKEIKKYVSGEQDGVYYLTCLDASIKPQIAPFSSEEFAQPIEYLYPERDRDNLTSDPVAAESYVRKDKIGKVVVSDAKHSLTKKVVHNFLLENGIGIGITAIQTDTNTGTSHTITLGKQHNLNRIISVGVSSAGAGYGSGSAATLYGAKLVGIGTTTGDGAIANVLVSAAGTITSVTITHGGGGYSIGQSLEVVGVATTAGFAVGLVTVTSVVNGIDEVVQVSGIKSESYQKYNDLFRVIGVPNSKSIAIKSVNRIGYTGVAGTDTVVGVALTDSILSVVGRSAGITTLTYDSTTGITTVGTGLTAHGLMTDQKIQIVGVAKTFFNGSFVIQEVVGLTTFIINPGVSSETSPIIDGNQFVFRGGYSSNNGLNSPTNEKLRSRAIPFYVGITTTLATGISSSSTSIDITNATNSGLVLGDFIVIDDEIMRINNNSINVVFRGVFGTVTKNHQAGAIVRKIKVVPTELRKSSHINSNGHYFNNVGFGQGNYSVAIPERQITSLTKDDRKLGQAQRKSGGQIHYSGINDAGEYFLTDKRYGSVSANDEIFEGPIPKISGIELNPADVHNVTEVVANNSITINGGPNRDIVSRFDGPVLFMNKLISYAEDGIETNILSLHGEAPVSRNITVGIATPIVPGGAGDVTFNANPQERGHLGWVFTQQNTWRKFGLISKDADKMVVSVDRIGIGTTTASDVLNVVGNAKIIGITTIRSGIGSAHPELVINANTTTDQVQEIPDGTELHITGENNAISRIAQDTFGANAYPAFTGRVARGTLASPSTTQNGDILVQMAGRGYGSTKYLDNSVARINFRAAQTFSDSNAATDISFEVTGINTTAPREVVRIGAGGSVGIGTTIPTSTLHVSGTARIAGIITATTAINTQLGVGTVGIRTYFDGSYLSSPTLDVVGDVRIGSGNTQGLVLTSPNGNLFRIVVDDTGSLAAISTSVLG
jgi:hypothetical protein